MKDDKLRELAKPYMTAKAEWNKAWCETYAAHPPCTKVKFYKILPLFREAIESFVFKLRRSNGVEQAADEMYRRVLTGETTWAFDDLIGFSKYYEKLDNALYQPLFDVVTGRGDDGYSDLLDSLPLADERIVDRCLASGKKSRTPRDGYLTNAEFEADLKTLGDKWYEFIADGENYVVSSLERAAANRWLSGFWHSHEGWTPDEQKLLTWAGRYDD